MDPEVKSLLEENLKFSKENNELLLKIRGVQRWARITKAFYWFIIIGMTMGSFYFIKPYLGGILNLYSGGVSNINTISGVKDALTNSTKNWQDLIKDVNQ